jgi:ferredoxin
VRIQLDVEKCTGHGRCYALAGEVYEPDDEGYCATRSLDVPAALEAAARRGAANCPESAITILE